MKSLRIVSVALCAFVFAPALHAEAPAAAAAHAFLRAQAGKEGQHVLQTLSSEFRPAGGRGPSIWLVGVSHLGTEEYYTAIQKRLDAQTVVLFEGIGLHDVKQGPGKPAEQTGVQSTLATALGLVFQLNAIDYRRPNFINSDLQVPELEKEVEERSAATGQPENETFNKLVEALNGTGATGGALNQMIGLLGSSSQMRETTKLMLIQVLGRAGEFLAMAQQTSPEMKNLFEVVLTQRNAVVLRDLRTQLRKLQAGQSIAVFYGAAHMDEIAKRLRQDLGYVPAEQVWDSAFAADAGQSGINPAQIQMMLDMMRLQMQQAKPVPQP
ncbi:MAG TPA: hypothetical protein VGO90_12145 [Chthoniobacteraceae bacterium]|nr:hypothetical protein [Chthoniobacteraceae bacterium]